jgi:hypothetical protein
MIFSSQEGHRLDTPTGIDNSRNANIPAKPADAERPVVTPVTGTHPCSRLPAAVPEQIIQAVRDLDMDHVEARRVRRANELRQ